MKATSKPYEMPETIPNIAAEPAVEYGMDMNTLRQKALEELMMIDSKQLMKQALSFLRSLKSEERSPAQMTLEELKEVLRQSEEDFKNGLYYTQEEMVKEIESWRKE